MKDYFNLSIEEKKELTDKGRERPRPNHFVKPEEPVEADNNTPTPENNN